MGKGNKNQGHIKAILSTGRKETVTKPKPSPNHHKNTNTKSQHNREFDDKYHALQQRMNSQAIKTCIHKEKSVNPIIEEISCTVKLAPPTLNLFPPTIKSSHHTGVNSDSLNADYIHLPAVSIVDNLMPADSAAEGYRMQQFERQRDHQKRGRYAVLENHINDDEIGRDIRLAPSMLRLG